MTWLKIPAFPNLIDSGGGYGGFLVNLAQCEVVSTKSTAQARKTGMDEIITALRKIHQAEQPEAATQSGEVEPVYFLAAVPVSGGAYHIFHSKDEEEILDAYEWIVEQLPYATDFIDFSEWVNRNKDEAKEPPFKMVEPF